VTYFKFLIGASPLVQLLRFGSRTSTAQAESVDRRATAGRGCIAPSGLGTVLLAGEIRHRCRSAVGVNLLQNFCRHRI
jgi:hypothetical protein